MADNEDYEREVVIEGSDEDDNGGSNEEVNTNPKGKRNVNPERVTNRVYVGNLSYETRWQDLKDHMRQAGNVVYAEVLNGPENRSKGCGIVEFDTREDALKAIKTLNDSELDKRLIFVREDREDKKTTFRPSSNYNNNNYSGNNERSYGNNERSYGGYNRGGSVPSGRKIFIGNLPWGTSWQDLKDAFSTVGSVVRADVLKTSDGRSRGQGTILFESKEDAQKAITQFHDTPFQGRTIIVREDRFG